MIDRALVAAAVTALLLALTTTPPATAAERDPATLVTAADVAAVLGSSFEARVLEPGLMNYEEESGKGYRVVEVSVQARSGIADLRAQLLQQGEAVEEVPALGEDAMYRPQAGEAMVQRTDAAGETWWLSVRVSNVDDAAATRRLAVALLERGAPRLGPAASAATP